MTFFTGLHAIFTQSDNSCLQKNIQYSWFLSNKTFSQVKCKIHKTKPLKLNVADMKTLLVKATILSLSFLFAEILAQFKTRSTCALIVTEVSDVAHPQTHITGLHHCFIFLHLLHRRTITLYPYAIICYFQIISCTNLTSTYIVDMTTTCYITTDYATGNERKMILI